MLTAPWLCANMESARRQEYVAVGVGSLARFFILFLFFPVLINSQLDHCLWPTGCHGDECCFNVVAKTGPICDRVPGCAASFDGDCCRNARPVYTDYGIMYGYAILLDDPLGYRPDGRRYLEIWRGVPYARPPTRENNLRFRKPVPPTQSSTKYDATYFRPSCAQPYLTQEDPFTVWSGSPYEWWKRISMRQTVQEAASVSEDCLYLNIYVVNETDSGPGNLVPGLRRKLPIVVFFDGLDHLVGSGNGYPGHVLAQLGLVVILVNYRLGPFGYLATQSGTTQSTDLSESDDVALGNYGLWDQVRALEFIRENAEKFFGDPDKITLVGHGSAAGDVALHLLSKHSGRRNPPLFHRVILMSGSDQMEGGFVKHPDESLTYAKELAHQVGCDVSTERTMLACLRGRTTEELQTAGGYVRIHRPVWLTKPWSPQVDGDFIEDRPENLWAAGKFAQIPVS
ncbi:hypothetical protein EG68_06132 [Paragonimus skrjabini miyazakii]|uniref:Carboxylesterase type B domain-containing protein n=1 Tax=Paragonimus skrjabini miyazakii TaxID=59628 RepID=A0A8S9YZ33_9TREM|nr:hypothetical protein EG68_06132 [Paragonimus skrjabini miyazakii]